MHVFSSVWFAKLAFGGLKMALVEIKFCRIESFTLIKRRCHLLPDELHWLGYSLNRVALSLTHCGLVMPYGDI